MSSSTGTKSRAELIANIPRTCLVCDSCGKPGPAHECRKCCTAHYCSSACLRNLASHECHDLETMRNALIGIGASLDVSQAKNDTCGICLEMPMIDPAVLPGCQHAFCRGCLQKWHGMEKFQKEIRCPTCRGVMLFDKSDDNPIEKAKIYGAAAQKSKDDRPKLCQKALDELETFLAKDRSSLQALFLKAEILLIQSEPQMALSVLGDILEIDDKHRMERKAVSDYLDQSEAARQAGDTDKAEQIMELALEMAGKRGEKLGTILQNLVDVFLAQAEAYQQLEDWFTAKEIYKDLLGLGSGIPTWALGAASSAIVLLLTYAFFGSGPVATVTRQLSMATLITTALYGIFGTFLMGNTQSKSKVLTFPLELRGASVPQQRQCYMNMIECYYHLKEYNRAIRAGAFATHMNRHYAGVHEYIAKSHKAKGKQEEARRIMHQAILYETPWDVENIAKQLQVLEEIAQAA